MRLCPVRFYETQQSLITYLKKYPSITKVSSLSLYHLLDVAGIEPLQVASMHYGSPASFDLLGLARVVEVLRDTTLMLFGKHQRELAELERKHKQVDINLARLEAEKLAVEIAEKKLQVEIARNQIIFDTMNRQLDLIQKASDLQLSDDDRKLILSALIPNLVTITNTPAILTLLSKDAYGS